MRLRYFFTIMTVLIIVASVSVTLHALFMKKERLDLIDQQVRDSALALVDSELGVLKKINFEQAESIISEELGESRIGKFFIMRSQSDEIVFESSSAKLLPTSNFPRHPQWIKMKVNNKYIRLLNLQLPRVPDRTLQVGLILDDNFIDPDYLSTNSLAFIVAILAIGLIVSWLSSTYLLKPITELKDFLSSVKEKSLFQNKLPGVPDKMKAQHLLHLQHLQNDEFNQMVMVLDGLIDRVNRNYETSRLWSYQMAHELKTPLSILNLQIEKLQKTDRINSADYDSISMESRKISDTINSFLAWAEVENSVKQQHLFANKINDTVENIIARLFDDSKRPLIKNLNSNFTVISNPHHIEQLIVNLLSNADRYSPLDKSIIISTSEHTLTISDEGDGISQEVIHRLGEPFNRGDKPKNSSGHGLGLAWVNSICRLYKWKLSIEKLKQGTRIKIEFTDNDIQHN